MKKQQRNNPPLKHYSVRLNQKKVETVRKALAKDGITLSDLLQNVIDFAYDKIKERN